MTRSSFRPIASVGLVAVVLAYVGCSKTHITPDKSATTLEKNDSKPTIVAEKGKQVPKIIKDWSSKPPAGILLISGEQFGYPDPVAAPMVNSVAWVVGMTCSTRSRPRDGRWQRSTSVI